MGAYGSPELHPAITGSGGTGAAGGGNRGTPIEASQAGLSQWPAVPPPPPNPYAAPQYPYPPPQYPPQSYGVGPYAYPPLRGGKSIPSRVTKQRSCCRCVCHRCDRHRALVDPTV